jgi:hypothetical protein
MDPTTLKESLLAAIGILAATASAVAASGSRQEHLSSRARALASDLRELAGGEKTGPVAMRRLYNLPHQLFVFEARLTDCVKGHLLLYKALRLEAIAFLVALLLIFLYEIASAILDIAASRSIHPQVASMVAVLSFVVTLLTFALIRVAKALKLHIKEYECSFTTFNLEMSDVRAYALEMGVEEKKVMKYPRQKDDRGGAERLLSSMDTKRITVFLERIRRPE